MRLIEWLDGRAEGSESVPRLVMKGAIGLLGATTPSALAWVDMVRTVAGAVGSVVGVLVAIASLVSICLTIRRQLRPGKFPEPKTKEE